MTETQEQTPRKHVRGSKKKTAAKASAKTTAKTVKSGAKATATRKRAGKGANTTPQYGENAAKGKKLATSDTNDTNRIAPPKYRKGSMRIVPLGGLGEIGRNMNVIEYNGHILLIDCGVLFPEEEQPGVDLILPDFNYIKDRLDKVDALVLTHGHEDHIGGVPYLLKLRKDIPLIGSKLTLGFVEAKCKEHHIEPETIQVEGRDKLKVGPFNLEFVTVTHSIPDALAVCVRTPAGSLIDTGDIKLDQLPLDHRVTDLVEFGKLGEQGIDLLMMDSTNAEVPGFVKPETSIGPALDQVFATATRKIIVASFSSHVHRVQQVVDAAHKYGRKVVFVGRSMVRNMAIAADLGYLHLPEDTVIDLKKAKDYPDNKLVYMCTGSQGEPMAALGRIADGNHRDITINEFDTVILASSLIPGNEHGVYKVINKLVQLGARVVNRDNAAVHVSGHCNEGELLYMYNIVKPKNAMPIHGENRHLVADALPIWHRAGERGARRRRRRGRPLPRQGRDRRLRAVRVHLRGRRLGRRTDRRRARKAPHPRLRRLRLVLRGRRHRREGRDLRAQGVSQRRGRRREVVRKGAPPDHRAIAGRDDGRHEGRAQAAADHAAHTRQLGGARTAPQADDRACRGGCRGRHGEHGDVLRLTGGMPARTGPRPCAPVLCVEEPSRRTYGKQNRRQ